MKRIVCCCDGTWNTADQPSPTNVEKFAKEVAPTTDDGTSQLVHYHDGVGTQPWDKYLGGIFGIGLSAVVREVYRFLLTTFRPGDELYLVGFSRGAYTARSVAGLIRNCGVLRPEYVDRLDDAYDFYRRRDPDSSPDAAEAVAFREKYSVETRIHFVGVWDTVGSLGIPLSGNAFIDRLNEPWQFHDTRLSSRVDYACHALAIDEHRAPYTPTLWSPPDGPVERAQTWFPGVHSDVGGGYPQHGLADVTLRWVAMHAAHAGLVFHADSPLAPGRPPGTSPRIGSVDPQPLADAHDSLSWPYRLLGPIMRTIGAVDQDAEAAAVTAVTRFDSPAARYRPTNLAGYLERADHRVDDDAALPVP